MAAEGQNLIFARETGCFLRFQKCPNHKDNHEHKTFTPQFCGVNKFSRSSLKFYLAMTFGNLLKSNLISVI
jgi:hypothetical protein